MTHHHAFLHLYSIFDSSFVLFHVLRRRVAVFRQYLWRCGQRRLCALQRRYLLSSWHGHAVNLSLGFFLPGRGRCAGRAASRVFFGVVLQPDWYVSWFCLPAWTILPDFWTHGGNALSRWYIQWCVWCQLNMCCVPLGIRMQLNGPQCAK
jgi:hypothetical protein